MSNNTKGKYNCEELLNLAANSWLMLF
ncbi:hypothetical protein pEaSNUABM17_00253 [Erwinia phage pEa_SNUABM_17]|uniref:Uncharacterized protein n=1 Tax=Erwinia phage pEa_SNUABM_17 TaxID=2869545 RepID=A0AAE7XMN7_9CAUD|nr:hypothetical protein MPK72_gp253 [Erwinia phage pEa_SNUABM_17]QZE57799.1 hypothetical protein pEaSNUABM17_00253 [Erwinia phage pEa_SNUABM_17]